MTKRLLLGTETGLLVLEKENGAWAKSAESLEGKWVQKLEIDASGRLYAGITHDGVYWADSASGPWTHGLEGRHQRVGSFSSSIGDGFCRDGAGGCV